MLLRLEGGGPLYQRIYRALRRDILAGQLAPGTRLPSTRELAEELGIARNTTLLAYDQLLAEGYVDGRNGSGTYVASAIPDPIVSRRAPTASRPGVRGLARPRLSAYARRITADPPRPAPSERWRGHRIRYDFRYAIPAVADFPHRLWRQIVNRRLRTDAPGSVGYGRAEGYGPLCRAIAAYLQRARGVRCAPEQIVVVNGSQQALDLTSRVLLDVGDRVVIEDPHSQGAREAFLAAGARLVPGPVDTDGLNVALLPRASAQARFAYITPSHQFPTGSVMSLPRRLALLSWAARVDAYILEHDYDGEYRYEGRPIEAVQALDRAGRVIYVGTFSRVLFPALRLGYMVLPESLLAPVKAAKQLTDRHTVTFQQEVLADLIAGGHFERCLRRARKRLSARRATLLQALAEHLAERVEIQGANAGTHVLVWLREVPARRLSALIDRAAEAGIGLYPATPYYLRAPRLAGFLMGYAAMTPDDIRAGVRRLAAVLR